MNIHLGSSQAHIAFTINTQSKKVGTEIYIDDNKELFAQLLLQKEQIEHELQLQLIWDDSPNKASRIKLIKDDFQINDETKYPEYFDWMYENVIKFQNIFGKYIKQYTSNKKG
jgi:hypothetical protein